MPIDAQCGFSHCSSFQSGPTATSDQHIINLMDQQVLGPGVMNSYGQLQLRRTIASTALHFLATDSHSSTYTSGRTTARITPGTPPPGPHIQHPLARLQQAYQLQAVHHVALHEPGVVGVAREVELLVPVPQELAVAIQAVDLVVWQTDRLVVSVVQ